MLNASIRNIPLPPRLLRRPVSERGFPVPWFVSLVNGKWDFVNLDPRKLLIAYNRKICWLCGEPLGQYKAFVIGPMCSINRVSSEPPSHADCAEYAVKACPFLARPNAKRNEAASVGKFEDVAGIAIQHNPEATLIWTTRAFRPMRGIDGVLFELGEPTSVSWWKEGRPATRAEIDASFEKGLPYLRRAAEMGGREDVEEMEAALKRAQTLLPVE